MNAETILSNTFLGFCLWQSMICVALGLLGSLLLRRRPARAHQVLILSLALAVLLPVLSTLVSRYNWGFLSADPVAAPSYETITLTEPAHPEFESALPYFNTPMSFDTTVPEPSSSLALSGELSPAPLAPSLPIPATETTILPITESPPPAAAAISPTFSIPWRLALLTAWAAAALFLLTRLIIRFLLGRRLIRNSRPLTSRPLRHALHRAAARLHLSPRIHLVTSSRVKSPLIWCWSRRPILVLAPDSTQKDRRVDWISVFCHELAHWKRRDHLSGLLAEILVCLLPWNPLLWWAGHRLQRLSEQACDDWVLAAGRSGPDYAQSLLDLLPQPNLAFAPAVLGGKKQLHGRIRRLILDRSPHPRSGARWSLLAASLAFALALTVAFSQTAAQRPPDERDREHRGISAEEEYHRHLDELKQQLREFTEQIHRLKAELRELPPEREDEARRILAEIRERQEQMQRLERELPERERPQIEKKKKQLQLRQREAQHEDMLIHRRELQTLAEKLEQKLHELPDNREDEAHEIKAELRDVRAQLENLNRALRDRELPSPDERERQARLEELMMHLKELVGRAEDIKRQLEERPGEERARRLQAELDEIGENIRRIKNEVGEQKSRRVQPRLDEQQPRLKELMGRRKKLLGRAEDIERQLGKRPGDERARDLHAELVEIHENIRRIENELRELEMRRREQPRRDELQANLEKLMRHRNELRGRAEDIERQLEKRPGEERARDLHAELVEIHENIRRIENELRELEMRRREQPRREELQANLEKLMSHRNELRGRAEDIERELEKRPGEERARQLRDEIEKIHQYMQQLERKQRQLEMQMARPEHPGEFKDRDRPRPESEAEAAQLRSEVRSLREEVNQLRDQMHEIRQLLQVIAEQRRADDPDRRPPRDRDREGDRGREGDRDRPREGEPF